MNVYLYCRIDVTFKVSRLEETSPNIAVEPRPPTESGRSSSTLITAAWPQDCTVSLFVLWWNLDEWNSDRKGKKDDRVEEEML